MFDINNKEKLKEQVIEWLRTYNYFNGEGTLADQVDYNVAYDMKSSFEENTNIPLDEFDDWYDLFIEDTLLPILRELGAINEDE